MPTPLNDIHHEISQYKRASIRTKHIQTISNCLRIICTREPIRETWDELLDKLPNKLIGLIQEYRNTMVISMVMLNHSDHATVCYIEWNAWARTYGIEYGNRVIHEYS
jgi:hypothetical protein